ncbi:hypothetical protein ACQPW1_14650 [Nocardia sp. CA-128927]|uniref:hypothetical protein n=1 Tax=Nocardia sp. CA-128927 TaxID=3239975 RepID=UPI003D97E213
MTRRPPGSTGNFQRTIDRFRHLTATGVATDVLRAAKLAITDPLPQPASSRSERIVVSLSTIPERATRLRPTLRSLLDQTCPADRIVLAWPATTFRNHRPYPPVPPIPAGVDILPCEDSGPATKLIPATIAEPDSILVIVDDDVIYPRTFLADLLRAHRTHRDAALGLRGWHIASGIDWPRHIFGTGITEPVSVDVLLGTWGILIPPTALGPDISDFTGWPPEIRWADDVWTSGHLARRAIPRLVIPATGLPIETRTSTINALSTGINRTGTGYHSGISAFQQWW